MKRHGCAIRLMLLMAIAAIWILMAYGVYKIGSLAIESLIPAADAAEICALPESSRLEADLDASPPISADTSTQEPKKAEYETITEEAEEPEDFENEKIEAALLGRAHRIERCKITYYCCEMYPHICGTGDGITAMGTEVTPGMSCAVPKPIPLGSTIIIDWGDGSDLEYRVGDDRGGGVIGDHIDLAVPLHREALDLGVKYATVYIVEEAIT